MDRRSESSSGCADDERALAAIRRIIVDPVHIRTPDPTAGVQSEEKLGGPFYTPHLRPGQAINGNLEHVAYIRLRSPKGRVLHAVSKTSAYLLNVLMNILTNAKDQKDLRNTMSLVL